MNRRDFLTRAGAAAVWPGPRLSRMGGTQKAPQSSERELWVALISRVADPVLNNLAAGTLKSRMPVEQAAGANRAPVTHLEALGRLIAGMAPWIELPADASPEGRARAEY